MTQADSGDRAEHRREGLASRLPWRYGEVGRRRAIASMSAGRTAAGDRTGRDGARGKGDIDDHFRLAVREESAATLGRAGRKLQAAVAALVEFDRSFGCDVESGRLRDASPLGPAGVVAARRPLLCDAARALWEYVVQREAIGLTSHDLLEESYGVTPELWRLMGSAEGGCAEAGSGR